MSNTKPIPTEEDRKLADDFFARYSRDMVKVSMCHNVKVWPHEEIAQLIADSRVESTAAQKLKDERFNAMADMIVSSNVTLQYPYAAVSHGLVFKAGNYQEYLLEAQASYETTSHQSSQERELCGHCHKPIIDEDEACMDGGDSSGNPATDKLFCSASCESAHRVDKKEASE